MAGFYWYEREPELWKNEQIAMGIFFPQFEASRLTDGRIAWTGAVTPRKGAGHTWIMQVVYNNNHPNNSSYGGSIRVYPIQPDLDAIAKVVQVPHVLRDETGHLYICTSRAEDFEVSDNRTTSAVSALGWACKWIFLFEEYLEGENVGDELFKHVY